MADIKTHLNNIKGALYGKDVRGSIHDGMDAMNKEVENTTGRQVDLESTFDQLVINAGNSNAEIVDARVKNDGTSYSKLGDRLNAVDSQLEHIENKTHHYISVYNFEQTDSEVDFYKLIQEAKEKNIREIVLESKTYTFNNPIKITDITGLKIKGSGHMVGTTFRFNNNTVDETFITLGVVGGQVYSSFTSFENINFLDNNSNSTCFKIIGSQINGAQANWKNYFSNCQISDFKTGVIFDTVTPNIPHTHGYGAESMFFNCKFKNNKTSIITRNYQSVNTHFIGTDIENDKANEEFTFIEAQCGIGIDFTGGSFIGKGKLLVLKGEIPNTHPSSTFIFKDLRFELWEGHNGVLIDEDKSFDIFSETFIMFDKCSFICFNQDIDFIRYSSRITLNIDKCKALAGSLIIKHYPTIARSGVLDGAGEYGKVKINNSCGFYFEKQKTSPYGIYDTKYRNRCLIQNSFASGNGAISTVDGFKKLNVYDNEQIGMELGMVNFKHIVYNNEQSTVGFRNVKISLPKYARPCKFFVYKQPIRYSNPIQCKLYLVKDKEYWVNQNEFSVDTDAILVSTIDTSGGAGYYESEIRLNTNSIGDILQAGDGEGAQTWTWNEGNLYIQNENSWGNSFAGFVGVTYI